MKLITTVLAFVVFTSGLHAQDPLAVDMTLPIPKVAFDGAGNLVISASPTSSATDFDYLVGKWRLRNKRLTCRLGGCTEWSPVYETTVIMTKILNGIGNIDNFYDSSGGKKYEGVAVRLFNPKTRLWSIYWSDSNTGAFDPPMVGSFAGKVGHFFCKDVYQGTPVIEVFRWDVRNPWQPIWSQAFSADNGKTWEWNMINVSQKVD